MRKAMIATEAGNSAQGLGIANSALAYKDVDWIADDRRHLLTTGMSEYTQNGVIGRPSLASAEKGKALLASFVDSFASVLDILRKA